MVANTVADVFKNSLHFYGQQEGQAVGKGNMVQNKGKHFKGKSVSSCESLKHSEQSVVQSVAIPDNIWTEERK